MKDNNKAIYAVMFKESYTDLVDNSDVECGVCEYGYEHEDGAIAKIKELVKEKKQELMDDIGESESDISTYINHEGDFGSVICDDEKYEFWVVKIYT